MRRGAPDTPETLPEREDRASANKAARAKAARIAKVAKAAAPLEPARPVQVPALPKDPAAREALFRDAVIEAACEVGADGNGTDGLKGYLRSIARSDPKTYFGVLAKLIPSDTADGGETVTRIERVIVQARE